MNVSNVTTRVATLLAGAAVATVLACNSAEFGGSGSNSSPAKPCDPKDTTCTSSPTPAGPSPGDPGTPGSCSVDGDKLNVAWSGDVKTCLIDQGKTYNFDLKKCAEMRQAKFECTWENVTKELEDRGLLTNVLKTDSQNGSKLVSCGQSDDGNRIVVQWVKLPDGGGSVDCSKANAGASITTGCYTLWSAGETRPPDATNDDERARQVYDCMNKL